MRIEIKGKNVSITSENRIEALQLTDVYLNFESTKEQERSEENTKIVRKPHKRHMFAKTCGECGKVCRGHAALGSHMASHRREAARQGIQQTAQIPVTQA